MPNGFHGSESDWQWLDEPLQALDQDLRHFAAQRGMRVLSNEHSWPSRSLLWNDGVHRKIQIHLEDVPDRGDRKPADDDRAERRRLYRVWAVAWEDRTDGRYWNEGVIADGLRAGELEEQLPRLLDRALTAAIGWAGEDLQSTSDD